VVDSLEIFGANLRRTRRAKGLTQEQLALAADVHTTHVSKIERSLCDPGSRTVAKLIAALGITGGPLFEGTVEPP